MALWSDTRFALRQLRKSPGFALIVIGTLALCIGVNTAVFSVLDAVLLRAAPYPEPDRLALVVTATRDGSAEEYQHFADRRPVRSGSRPRRRPGRGGERRDGRRQLRRQRPPGVHTAAARLGGVLPRAGRRAADGPGIQPRGRRSRRRGGGHSESTPSGSASSTATPRCWATRFSLRGEEYTVVGIMPRDFRAAAPVDVWTPLRPSRHGEGGGSNYEAIARLKPGVSWAQAGEQLRSLSQALNADPAFPREAKNFEERIIPLQTGATEDVTLRTAADLGRGADGAADRLRQHRGTSAGALRRARPRDRDAAWRWAAAAPPSYANC